MGGDGKADRHRLGAVSAAMSDDRIRNIDSLALEMAASMDGLDMADIEQVFAKAAALVKLSVRLDINSLDFQRQADGFSRHYGTVPDPTLKRRQ
jgi:hypothetical protein